MGTTSLEYEAKPIAISPPSPYPQLICVTVIPVLHIFLMWFFSSIHFEEGKVMLIPIGLGTLVFGLATSIRAVVKGGKPRSVAFTALVLAILECTYVGIVFIAFLFLI